MIAAHLWQSTLFAAAIGLLTLLLQRNSARVRYWVWFAALVKFLVPFGVLVSLGGHVSMPAWTPKAPSIAKPAISFVMGDVAQQAFQAMPAAPQPANTHFPPILLGLWACGFTAILFRWIQRWMRVRADVRAAARLPIEIGIPAVSSPVLREPGVFGVFRPVLVLPDGMAGHLSKAEWDAILAHELCHVRCRDNLTAGIYMLVESVFWFHPLVWWMGKRLVAERELACDEEVLRLGSEPKVYAEGILKVCELYLESPIECVAGVTGSNLRRRIRAIMTHRGTERMNMGRKLILMAAGAAALAVPIVIGMLNAPALRAQSSASTPRPSLVFEVASVKPSPTVKPGDRVYFGPARGGPGTPDPGQITWTYARFFDLLMMAYDVKNYQISGPAWLADERYDVIARVPAGATKEQVRAMWQNLLAERFGLALHHETREFRVDELAIAKGGERLKESAEDAAALLEGKPPELKEGKVSGPGMIVTIMPGANGAVAMHAYAKAVPISRLTSLVGAQVNLPVLDKTGLNGYYDFTLEFTAMLPTPPVPGGQAPGDVVNDSGPNIDAALQQQLGLKLVGSRAQLDVIVIDKAEKVPTAN